MKRIILLFLIFISILGYSQTISLVYPKDKYVSCDSSILFKWNYLNNNDTFVLQLSNDSTFNTIISEYNNITNNQILIDTFVTHKKYFWRVGINNYTKFSQPNVFHIFSPNDINSIGLWLNADSSNIIFESGKIKEWKDLSSNQNHLYQNDNSLQPLWTDSLINNKPCVSFSSANEYFNFTDSIEQIGITIYSIAKNNELTYGSYILGKSNVSAVGLFLNLDNTSFKVKNNRTVNFNHAQYNSFVYLKSLYDTLHFGDYWQSYYAKQQVNSEVSDSVSMYGYPFICDRLGYAYWYGTYKKFNGELAELIIYYSPIKDSLNLLNEQYLRYKYAPPANLGYDIHVSYGFCDTTIDAGARFTNYLWSTGDTTQTITVNQPGQYSVTVTDIFGFESSDSLMVYYPQMNQQQNDSIICYGDTIKWNAGLQDTNYTFLWNTAETDSIISISTAGEYYVQITDTFGCSYKSDTAHITIDNYPITTILGNDTSLCAGQNLYLQTGASETVNYLWSDGSSNDNITINTAGDYSVTATNSIGCVATDTINIQIHGQAPIPGFDFTNTCFNDLTQFSDTSYTTDNSNIINWYWDFGNSQTSNLQNPELQFLDTGIYTISLEIVTDSNCTNLLMKNIEIHSLPISNYTNTQLCQNNNITFTNLSTIPKGNISSYYWDFGNGDFSTDTNPTYLYNNYGYYDLELISISDFNCKDTLNKTIEIKPSPISDFLTSATCKNKVVSFYNNTTTLPYNPVYETYWDFGDGTTSSGTNPNYIYNGNDTIYNVSLRTKTINGCQDTIVKQIRLYNNPKANFTNDKICVETYTQLFNSSNIDDDTIANYVWQIENNFYYEENPTVYFTNSGNATIILTVTSNNNCSDKIETLIPILELPNPDFDINPKWGITNEYTVFSPQNEGSNYWDFGNGTTSSDSISYTVYPDSGIFIVEHIIIDSNNCIDTIYKDYRVVIPQNDIAITDLRYSIKNNILSVETDVINIGNLPVNKIKFTLSPDKYSSISETWEGELIYGYGMTYYFNATFSVSSNKLPEYVCVMAEISDKYKDTNPSNNSYCANNSNDIVLYPIYPNPAENIINISFKLESNSHVSIKLFDNLGKTIANISNQDYNKGFHKLTYNISSLSSGHYTISIDINNKNNVVKFIKADN